MERNEIAGMEFDWLAVDQDGAFALFATGGAGPVPTEVLDNTDQHGAILEDIPVLGWGSQQVWQSYARAGLFAYDWREALGAYARVAAPIQPLDVLLAERLRDSNLPRLNVSFLEDQTVRLPVISTS